MQALLRATIDEPSSPKAEEEEIKTLPHDEGLELNPEV